MAEITGTGETGLTARYAAALYALAFERNALNDVVGQMAALGRLIAESPALKALLANPLTDIAKAGPALNEALSAQGVGELVCNFIGVVAANRRLRDLPALVAGFASYAAAKRGELPVKVTTAHELTDLQRTQLRARLTEAGYGNVMLTERVDAGLLGGMVLQAGAKIYDTSLKSRLNRLNYSLKGAA
ncbi:ATP synthase F1 subunit delta [Acidocella sp.]|uniref:ATP synthase F1 subunit delta n=1 Tax=Acidocella sp. TaxID=50710 RepID=UPI00261B7739|nr:ATP synthase F1 subunit delta [Acidocella sp.]